MNPEDWNEIKQVFSAALALPPAERDAYVRAAAADRPALGAAVDELLRAHYGASQSFLEPGSVVLSAPWLFREGDRVANRFTVARRIARGAMGEVYQVYDERLRQSVALKAIRPELIGDADSVERFRREVLVTRGIGHPGVCKVFDLVEHPIAGHPSVPDGTIVPCLTMQLLEGESLEEWLARRRPMRPAEALPLIAQIGEALQALHDAGVVHRDLKPSNVMIIAAPDGPRAVLTDFGLARPLKTDLFETQVRVQGGAPFFMAPELFESERPSRASDMYAFGLLIDEMVTERRAFEADSLHGLMLKKLGEGPERPSRRSTGLPRVWEQAILRCLSRDPRDRPASARGVCASLVDDATGRRGLLAPSLGARASKRFRYATAVATVLVGGAVLVPVQTGTVILIQPFSNHTGNAALKYLADGTESELGRRLSRLSNVRVHRPPEPIPPDAALDGTLSLSGLVQGSEAELRITVELKDAATNIVLWSYNVDGPQEKALQLEEQLGAAAVGALTRLDAERRSRPVAWTSFLFRRVIAGPKLPEPPTRDNEAYRAYLRALSLHEDRTGEAALAAMRLLHQAVSADPNFALAYALMADVQGTLMDTRKTSHARFIDEADRYASQAVALQPDLAEAQLSLAAVRQAQWRWTDAEAAYLRSLALFRGSAVAHRWYGGLLLQFGRFDESLDLYRRSLEIDPYDVPGKSAYGHALFHAGRAREAAAWLEALVARQDLMNAHVLLGQVYAYLGSVVPTPAVRVAYRQKALGESDVVRRHELQGGTAATTPRADMLAALAWSYQGALTQAAPYVDRLERGRAMGDVTASTLARVYGAQGDAPRAVAALLEAEAQHDRDLLYVNVSPHYSTIRQDAGFRALVGRLHLAE